MLSFKEYIVEQEIDEAVGLTNRTYGEIFVTPEGEKLIFQNVRFFDSEKAYKGKLSDVTFVNSPIKNSSRFAVVTFKDESAAEKKFGRYLTLGMNTWDNSNPGYFTFKSKAPKSTGESYYVRDKQFIPSVFGLTGKSENVTGLTRLVTSKLKEMKLEPDVYKFCIELLSHSNKGLSSFTIDSELQPSDINIILKDFGEITSAVYLMKNYDFKSVRFPKGNLPLVDFFMMNNEGLEEPYSIKSNKGSKPTISSLMDNIGKIKSSKNNLSTEIQVLEILANPDKDTVYSGPLAAAKYLNLPVYSSLIKILKRFKLHSGNASDDIPTRESLIKAIEKSGDDPYKTLLEPYYTDAGYKASKKALEYYSKNGIPTWGALHYPITSALIQWLNSPSNKATELLNAAANAMSLSQIYLNTTGKSQYAYVTKTFADSKFKFGSPSSVPYPLNNRIGFEMHTS